MAEEEVIQEVEQQPPQIQPQLQPQKEKRKPGRPRKQPQEQPQPQQIKVDDKEKKGTTALSKKDKELFDMFKEKYGFEWENKKAGAVVTRVGDDIIFVRKIPVNKGGYIQYKNNPYLILKTNIEKFKKIKNDEVAKKEKKEKAEKIIDDKKKDDENIFEFISFSKDYFDENEKLFADSLKQKKFLFNNLGEEKKEEEKEVQNFGWNEFKNLDIIPGISNKDEEKYIGKLEKFNVDKIHENSKLDQKDISNVIDLLFSEIKASLKNGDTIELRGFGTFKVKYSTRKEARDPRNGEKVTVEPHYKATFIPGKDLQGPLPVKDNNE